MRTVRIDADRVPGWAARFGERHGEVVADIDGQTLRLAAADGSWAALTPTLTPIAIDAPATTDTIEAWAQSAAHPPRTAVILVRRGGFLAAVVDGGAVVAGRAGRRHVQGQTAAGGWSQQRFARRREKQADALVDAAADYAAAQVLPHLPVRLLVTGGDPALVAAVLTDRRLSTLADLPRGPHLGVPNPNPAVLRELPALLAEVSIEVYDVQRDPITDAPGSPPNR